MTRSASVVLTLLLTMLFTFTGSTVRVSSAAPACDSDDGRGLVGVVTGSAVWGWSNDALQRTFSAARAAGVRYVRIDVDWSRIEPTQGIRDWSSTDRVINEVMAQGMSPLGLLSYTPAWARNPADHPTDTHFRPRDPQEFAAFARDAATHFLGRISTWEVWNEPNITDFYKPEPNVAEYSELLAATYGAIKAVDASLFVISGGLSPAVDGDGDIAPLTFVQGLYEQGTNGYFDALGMHPYTFPALPTDPETAAWSAYQQMWPIHDVMAAGGDDPKTIWMTEFGAPTGTAPDAVTEAVQADTMRIVLTNTRNVPWMGPAFVYNIRDAGTDPSDREQNFGLLRNDFSEKPAYAVVRDFGCRS